jgi:plasmid replication initiation protein
MKEITATKTKKTLLKNTSHKSDIIIKSRDLNEAHFPNFSLNEYRLFSLILSKAVKFDKNDKENFIKCFHKIHVVTPQEFSEIFDVHISHCYQILRECGEALYQNDIIIKNKKTDTLTKTRILDKKIYNEENHTLEIGLSLRIIDYLDVSIKYVKTRLYQIAKFKSLYSIRLYELVTSFRSLGKFSVSVERLRFLLGVDENKLKEYNNFKQRAITPAIKEVNKICNFDIKNTEKKEGKKVAIIDFTCKKSKSKELDDDCIDNNKALSITYEEDVRTRLINIGVEKKIVNKYKNCSDAKLEKAHKAIKKAIESKTLRTTTTAYFRYLIEI